MIKPSFTKLDSTNSLQCYILQTNSISDDRTDASTPGFNRRYLAVVESKLLVTVWLTVIEQGFFEFIEFVVGSITRQILNLDRGSTREIHFIASQMFEDELLCNLNAYQN